MRFFGTALFLLLFFLVLLANGNIDIGVKAETTQTVYESGEWSVDRDNETGRCFITHSDNSGIIAFTESENFEYVGFILPDNTPEAQTVTVHFTGLANTEDTAILNVTKRAGNKVSIATDSFFMLDLLNTALGVEITYGDWKREISIIDAGVQLVPQYFKCADGIR